MLYYKRTYFAEHLQIVSSVIMKAPNRRIFHSWFQAYCLIQASKKIIQPSPMFPPLHREFHRLIIAASIDH